ncbi:MAG TPA: hypothetical protein VJB89_00805 [Candidatus Nanoarchaeia archaeon]|nr:hypothetical protein [Candidatus Nanoarchaeia archaeon]
MDSKDLGIPIHGFSQELFLDVYEFLRCVSPRRYYAHKLLDYLQYRGHDLDYWDARRLQLVISLDNRFNCPATKPRTEFYKQNSRKIKC